LLLEDGDLFVVCGGATVLRLLAVKLEGRKFVSALELQMALGSNPENALDTCNLRATYL